MLCTCQANNYALTKIVYHINYSLFISPHKQRKPIPKNESYVKLKYETLSQRELNSQPHPSCVKCWNVATFLHGPPDFIKSKHLLGNSALFGTKFVKMKFFIISSLGDATSHSGAKLFNLPTWDIFFLAPRHHFHEMKMDLGNFIFLMYWVVVLYYEISFLYCKSILSVAELLGSEFSIPKATKREINKKNIFFLKKTCISACLAIMIRSDYIDQNFWNPSSCIQWVSYVKLKKSYLSKAHFSG